MILEGRKLKIVDLFGYHSRCLKEDSRSVIEASTCISKTQGVYLGMNPVISTWHSSGVESSHTMHRNALSLFVRFRNTGECGDEIGRL